MKILRPTTLVLSLTLMLSSTAFAGNIGGLRTSGNIGGLRTSGNTGGARSAGNIGGIRTAGVVPSTSEVIPNHSSSRLELGAVFSGSFTNLMRMLLESGALL